MRSTVISGAWEAGLRALGGPEGRVEGPPRRLPAGASAHSLRAMSDGDDDTGRVVEDWRREGTCSACTHFRSDYGEPPVLYGHCKMYTRTGMRGSRDSTCGEFRPLPGFGPKVVLTTPEVIGLNRATPQAANRAESAQRRRSLGGGALQVVRRRTDAAGEVREGRRLVALGGDALVDDGIVAALFGEEGGDVDRDTLREVLLDVIEQFIGVEDVELGKKWQGGTMSLQPEDTALKPYEMPVETFFHKIVMLRDNLRRLEAKVNAHEGLSDADKVEMQQYVSKCYGSLTSFNALFKNRDDAFSSK